MKIKMAAIDLDGTLLHDDMSLSDFSKDIIRKAEHRGIHIVLATGVCLTQRVPRRKNWDFLIHL